tara:strand:- start:4977 stop:5624 length:648 start_codon:yes stop_codon:yes gene_type:complete
MVRLLAVAIVAILGIYFMMNPGCAKEGFCNDKKPPYRCPDVLIQHGKELELRNTRLANVPGVNPIKFANLDEYVEFTKWQRSQGIRCPVLYLQHSYDTQGKSVYKARPSPTDLRGGAPDLMPRPLPMGGRQPAPVSKLLDAARNDPPYNKHSYPGFDPQDQYIGLNTPLDQMYHSSGEGPSPSAMDTTWGGQRYTQALVDAGYYKGDSASSAIST